MRGFWQQLLNFFGNKPKPQIKKSVAKAKKADYVAVNETQVKVDIVKNLTEFFKIQEQLAAHIREEEDKSKNIYEPTQNHMEAALNRVMAQQQMAELEITIRETMVYQSPPEMGALYSSVFEMREVIQEEQEQARLKQEAQERYKQWQRREEKRDLQQKSAYLVMSLILIAYLWMWLLFVGKLART
jgi:hypothetical protein